LPDAYFWKGRICFHSSFEEAWEEPNIWIGLEARGKGSYMTEKKRFSTEEANRIGKKLGITWIDYDVEQFRMGLDVELEHGKISPATNVTDDDPIMTGKIALAHLNEFPD
jgi:hypothetical protein